MPAARISMRLIKDVLRLTAAGLSQRAIADSLGLSHGVVGKYQQLAKHSQMSEAELAAMSEAELAERFLPAKAAEPSRANKRAEPDFAYIHSQLKLKGVTRWLLWEEYRIENPDGYAYTQFCFHYRNWLRSLSPTMRQTHTPGEKMFVDYCGKTIDIINAATGEVSPAQIFVATLGASNYTFAEATNSQQLADWIGSHTRAFAFFGGVARLVVPDNLKSAVTLADRYEPLINESYQRMLEHYGTACLPARPSKPRDKAKVESGVGVVTRWILARLRKQQFFSLFELNLAIRSLLAELNNRPFKRLPGCRRSHFDELEKGALQPVPATVYEYAEWRRARVGVDYHVEVERHYYSVPHSLLRKEVDVRATATALELFFQGKRVATHVRSRIAGSHSTQVEHMPAAHRAHLEWTPARFERWATGIGTSTAELVTHLLYNRPHPEQGYRSCLGLLGLAKTYGSARLEAACRRALRLKSPARRTVVSILKNNLEDEPLPDEMQGSNAHPPRLPLLSHENVRGSAYYQ